MASTVGILSQGIKLGYKEGTASTYTILDNLQEIPDLGQAPELIDVTCLADANKRSINGMVDYGTLEFTFLYDSGVYGTLDAMAGKAIDWQVELPDAATASGHGSQFQWTGQPSVALSGAAVNGALQFKLSISVASDLVFVEAE